MMNWEVARDALCFLTFLANVFPAKCRNERLDPRHQLLPKNSKRNVPQPFFMLQIVIHWIIIITVAKNERTI